ncbi:hypothetical protein GBAR_LOCUS12171, partial [Geodia barretti]
PYSRNNSVLQHYGRACIWPHIRRYVNVVKGNSRLRDSVKGFFLFFFFGFF